MLVILRVKSINLSNGKAQSVALKRFAAWLADETNGLLRFSKNTHLQRIAATCNATRAFRVNAMQSPKEAATPGTAVAVRFFLGEAKQKQLERRRSAATAAELLELGHWNWAIKTWARIVAQHGGTIIGRLGLSSFAIFPDSTEPGLPRAVSALNGLYAASPAEVDKVWQRIRFSAGLLPGHFVRRTAESVGLDGADFYPTRLFDVVQALADNLDVGKVATVDHWLSAAELAHVDALAAEPGQVTTIPVPGCGPNGRELQLIVVPRLFS